MCVLWEGIESTQILRRNLENAVVEFRTFFFLGHLNLFSLLHSEYVKLKHKSHCFLFAFSLFNFYSKVNIVCHSILLNLQTFSFSSSFFLSLLPLLLPCRSLENFSVSTFSSHCGVLYITHACGLPELYCRGFGDMSCILCRAWHKVVCQWKGS